MADFPDTIMLRDLPQYIDALIVRPQDTLLLVLKGESVGDEEVRNVNDALREHMPTQNVIVCSNAQAVVIRGADEVRVLS